MGSIFGYFLVTFWLLFGNFLVHFGVPEGLGGSLLPLGVPLGLSGGPWLSWGVPLGSSGGLFEDPFWSHISSVFLNDLRCSFLVCFCAVFGSLFDPFEGHVGTYFRQRALAKRKGRYAGYTVKMHGISCIL